MVTQSDFIDNALKAAAKVGIAKERIFLISPKGHQELKGIDEILSDGTSPHIALSGEAAKVTVAYLCYSSGSLTRLKSKRMRRFECSQVSLCIGTTGRSKVSYGETTSIQPRIADTWLIVVQTLGCHDLALQHGLKRIPSHRL